MLNTGIFEPEKVWKPVKGYFDGKLNWVSLLASKKNVSVRIPNSSTNETTEIAVNKDSESSKSCNEVFE